MFNEKQITKISKVLDDAKGLKPQQFTPTIKQAIVHAVSKESSLELKQKAWMLVYNSMYSYINRMVDRYVVQEQDNRDEYLNDIFIVIIENLGRWNPKYGNLITFFKPFIMRSCCRTQFKEQTFSSTHYKYVFNNILKAKKELSKKGIYEPDENQIYTVFKSKGLHYSLSAIQKAIKESNQMVSLDWINESVCSDNEAYHEPFSEAYDPLFYILKKEKEKEFKECLDSLNSEEKRILKIEYLSENGHHKRVTNQYIASMLGIELNADTNNKISNLRYSAVRKFIHSFNHKLA